MAANVTEDISLRNSSNLPAAELQKLNELNHLQGSNDRTGYYDVSPTDGQAVDVDNQDPITLNTVVPDSHSNSMETSLG